MAVTVAQLREALPGVLVEPPGLKWRSGDHTFFHYPPLKTDWGEIRVLVHLQDEGRYIQFRSIDLFTLSEKQRVRERQIEMLLIHNYRKKSVQFGFDPDDGEVCMYVDLPVLDGTEVTRRLMERVLASIRLSGADLLRELRHTVEETPAAPQNDTSDSPARTPVRLLRRVLRLCLSNFVLL